MALLLALAAVVLPMLMMMIMWCVGIDIGIGDFIWPLLC